MRRRPAKITSESVRPEAFTFALRAGEDNIDAVQRSSGRIADAARKHDSVAAVLLAASAVAAGVFQPLPADGTDAKSQAAKEIRCHSAVSRGPASAFLSSAAA